MDSATANGLPVLVALSWAWYAKLLLAQPARLIQVKQTGLCVYEVDDPNQRADAQDETARLISRVAELETVIREVTALLRAHFLLALIRR